MFKVKGCKDKLSKWLLLSNKLIVDKTVSLNIKMELCSSKDNSLKPTFIFLKRINKLLSFWKISANSDNKIKTKLPDGGKNIPNKKSNF